MEPQNPKNFLASQGRTSQGPGTLDRVTVLVLTNRQQKWFTFWEHDPGEVPADIDKPFFSYRVCTAFVYLKCDVVVDEWPRARAARGAGAPGGRRAIRRLKGWGGGRCVRIV